MKKVLCINPPSKSECRKARIRPLAFMATYTVAEEVNGCRGLGYVLAEVDNSHVLVTTRTGIPLPHVKASYLATRFIPLSKAEVTVEEKELAI